MESSGSSNPDIVSNLGDELRKIVFMLLDRRILRYLIQAYPKIKIYQVKNLMFNVELQQVEKKHPSVIFHQEAKI